MTLSAFLLGKINHLLRSRALVGRRDGVDGAAESMEVECGQRAGGGWKTGRQLAFGQL